MRPPGREMLFDGESARVLFGYAATPMTVLSQSPNDCFWRKADSRCELVQKLRVRAEKPRASAGPVDVFKPGLTFQSREEPPRPDGIADSLRTTERASRHRAPHPTSGSPA